MDSVQRKSVLILILISIIIIGGSCKNPTDTSPKDQISTPPVLTVPYVNTSDVTYIQPFGVPLDFGNNDIRPHMAIDFGCNDGVEFKASASGTLGSIWLEYSHSYQFNIIINEKYIIHYCMEPINIDTLTDEEKMAAIYFSPSDYIEKDQVVCKMVGGGGHLDWGLIIDGERVCPACYLSDDEYSKANNIFKNQTATFEGYVNLCPDNSFHTNPRQ